MLTMMVRNQSQNIVCYVTGYATKIEQSVFYSFFFVGVIGVRSS